MARERVGSTYQRKDGSWWARAIYTDSEGQRHDFNRRAKDERHAKKILKALIREIDDTGDGVIKGNITCNKYLDAWLDNSAKGRLAERTYADYRDILTRYIRPAIGHKRLVHITPLDIQKIYTTMQSQGLSARTIRYAHAVIHSALKQSVRWRYISRNPAADVDLPKQSRKEMKALSTEDAKKFLDACTNDRYGVLFELALITGMRPEEYLGLQWKADVNLQEGVLTVQRTLCWHRKGGGWYFGEPKTGRSRRSIPIPYALAQSLATHKRTQAEERLKAGPNWQDLDLVFTTAQGGPLLPQNLMRRHFKPILKRAGLPESVRMYDLRHSCASLLLAANENPKVVSERLGHATVVLTLDTYSHVLPTMQRAASNKLETLLYPTKDSKQRQN